jgi:hypothetical protein
MTIPKHSELRLVPSPDIIRRPPFVNLSFSDFFLRYLVFERIMPSTGVPRWTRN